MISKNERMRRVVYHSGFLYMLSLYNFQEGLGPPF